MSRPGDPNAKVDLLRAAEAEFISHGLDRAKVEDITARAGRSKGSFYLHFASKEDAFRQIVESMLARLVACVDVAPPPETKLSPSELALHLEQRHIKDRQVFEYIWQNRGVMRLLLEGGNSASFGYLIDQFAERAYQDTQRLIHWGIRQGLYRADLDVELASLVLSGAYDRVARHLVRASEKPDLDAWLREIRQLVLCGLATPPLARLVDQLVNLPPKPAKEAHRHATRRRHAP